jgi:putative hydrolases of HD superfamily
VVDTREVSAVSQLVPLLAKLKETGAERVFFAPGEPGYAFTGETKRPIGDGTFTSTTLVEAIAEVLSHDELRDLPGNRPRIVRHEYGGDDYVLEIVKQSTGIAIGIRLASARPLRVPTFRDSSRDSSAREPPREPSEAPKEPAKQEVVQVEAARPLSRRFRPSRNKLQALKHADKRTMRVELDEEGNPIDSVAVEIELRQPHLEAKVERPREPVPSADAKRAKRSIAGEPPVTQPGTATRGEAILATMLGLDPLSELPRTGWLLRGVRPCESIADHSFGVAFLAMLFVDAIRAEGGTIDGERTLRMALVHDAAEAKTGDIPMLEKTPPMTTALYELEKGLIRDLLPPNQQEAWADAELGRSLEARVVMAADKAQMMIKAMAYERHKRGQLDDFWTNPKNFDDRGVNVARELFSALAAAAGRLIPA